MESTENKLKLAINVLLLYVSFVTFFICSLTNYNNGAWSLSWVKGTDNMEDGHSKVIGSMVWLSW